MVGMPYPNAHDPEIVERMHSLDLEDSAGPEQHYKATAGQTFYEDLCMKVRSSLCLMPILCTPFCDIL